MREIKFRGQCLDGKWVYGSLYIGDLDGQEYTAILSDKSSRVSKDLPKSIDLAFDRGDVHIVHPATVGQYTTKCDRLQCEVYEGDIVRDELGSIGVVIFMEGVFAVDFGEGIELQELNTGVLEVCEIVGNRFDNPELLK